MVGQVVREMEVLDHRLIWIEAVKDLNSLDVDVVHQSQSDAWVLAKKRMEDSGKKNCLSGSVRKVCSDRNQDSYGFQRDTPTPSFFTLS